jgi:hypothetical protein
MMFNQVTRVCSLLGATVLAVLLGGGVAVASSDTNGPCVRDATHNKLDCFTGCKDDFQVAVDACIMRDHSCVDACRSGRNACRVATGFDAHIAQCNADLGVARANCRAHFADGSPELDQCIDAAQVVAFQCRDHARELAKPALRACRRAFLACARACPPGTPPVSRHDLRVCRRDASQGRKDCRAGCTETFQLAIDACFNRDHACVEGCRATRKTCLDPINATLQGKLNVFQSNRNTAVAACKVAFPNPGHDQDHCIDNAQVDAFKCRDQANEDAKPGIKACRQGFHQCAVACPPPGGSPSGAFIDRS